MSTRKRPNEGDDIHAYVVSELTEQRQPDLARRARKAFISREPVKASGLDYIVVTHHAETPERPLNWLHAEAVVLLVPSRDSNQTYLWYWCDLCGHWHKHGWPFPLPEPGASLGWWGRHCPSVHKPFSDACVAFRGKGGDPYCHVDHGAGMERPSEVQLFMPSDVSDADREAVARLGEQIAAFSAEYEVHAAALLATASVIQVLESMARAQASAGSL